MSSDIIKWLWLSICTGYGNRKAIDLFEAFGSIDDVFSAKERDYFTVPSLSGEDIKRLSHKDLVPAEEIFEICEKKKIRIITPQSEEYSERLLNIPTPPALLYAVGEKLRIDESANIGVVGTRNISQYGIAATKKISREIAECGGTVVTGLARGVDTFAAKEALSAGGNVIGVLGCGIDIIYPPENRALFGEVIKNGTIISEFSPGTSPTHKTFPPRNRIISGVSLGVVVVEAPEKSGALYTAHYAEQQDRDVFAVPAEIFSVRARGSNKLISRGARPVTSGVEIMREYKPRFGGKIKLRTEKTSESAEEKSFASEYPVLDEEKTASFSKEQTAVLKTVSGHELRADEISQKSGLPASQVLTLLTILEVRGALKRSPGDRFIIGNAYSRG